MAFTVWGIVEDGAAKRPDAIAIAVGEQSISFAGLRAAAAAAAKSLAAAGCRRGDRIVLVAPNSVEAFTALFAIAKLGAVFCPLNAHLTPVELEALIERLQPRAIIVAGPARNPTLDGILHGIKQRSEIQIWSIDEPPGAQPFATLVELSSDAVSGSGAVATQTDDLGPLPFLIQFTSGSTAAPKAVLLSQEHCARMGFEVAKRYGLSPGHRYFVSNPIHHVGCTNFGLMTALSSGAAFVSVREFSGPAALEQIKFYGCTHHHGLRPHYLYERDAGGLDPEHRTVEQAVAHGSYADLAREVFGPIRTVSNYGVSEVGGVAVASDYRDPENVRLNTQGKPLPDVEVVTCDPETRELLPAGEVGEIIVRGWCVMLGYWQDPEATSAVVDADGWYHTGDLGQVDGEGRLIYLGRIKDFIRVGGENVAASEIEQVLDSHPAVREAYVVPVPHPVLTEVPVAWIVLRPGSGSTTTAELVAYVSDRLAKYKVPRTMYVIDLSDLPITGPGKVKKPELAERARRRAQAEAASSGT
jgi:fatty-acyl-CoA synthase